MKRFFSPLKKKVIFFDLNDTLVSKDLTIKTCFLEVLNQFTARWNKNGEEWDPLSVYQRYKQEWDRLSQKKDKKKTPRQKLQLICLRHAFEPYPFRTDDAFLASFLKSMKEQQSDYIQLFPEVSGILPPLAENYTLAVISNGSEPDLRRIGLSPYISQKHVFTSDKCGFKKPHPYIYKHALNAMQITANQGVMVGNSWRADIYGATRAGLDAVWISRSHKKKGTLRKIGKEKVIIIRKLEQLTEIF
jgi:putative hydrolase of the HAD superfamily